MADNLTDYGERRALDYLAPSGATYLALFTTAPDDAGAGGVEVATTGGSAYVRQALTMAAAATVAGVTSKTNSAALEFPAAGTVWGTVVAYGFFDAASGGNMVWHRNLMADEQRAVNAGDTYRVAASAISFTAS